MKTQRIKKIALFIMIFTVAYSSFAQVDYTLTQSKSKLSVQGTSSMHDWEMLAGDLKSNLAVNLENGDLVEINEVTFSCPVEKILSDNSIMDGKTHNALKAEDHPIINFTLKSIEYLKHSGNNFSGELSGVLKIAGVSKTMNIRFSGSVTENQSLQIKGSIPLKMSDFDIKPPTAMFGALKTGNEVELHYDFHFQKS